MTELFSKLIDIFLHLDKYLEGWAGDLGPWFYAIIFLIVFCETGLVLTPFLPGDSLLFLVGALAAPVDASINRYLAGIILFAAAVIGDAVNYAIGFRLGPRVFSSATSRLFKKEHLLRTQRFYEKHGGKTIILARFIPIIRTFAPFVAGIGKMSYGRFAMFNVTGGFAWVAAFLLAGHLFGNVPAVKRNFQYVVIAIVGISVMPIAIEYLRARAEARALKAKSSNPKYSAL